MKKISTIFIILIIFLLTGCDSYIELNNLAIINTMGIEKKDNKYLFYASIVDDNKDNTMNPDTNVYTISGYSLNEIVDNLSLKLNKKIYMSHLDLLIINESIKDDDFKAITNYFLNNNESREDFLVVYTDDIASIIEKTKFKEINELIKINEQETSKTIYTTMFDIINNYYNKETIYLSNIIYNESVESNGLKEYFKNNYQDISSDDTIFINYKLDNINTLYYTYECLEDKYLYLNIISSRTDTTEKETLITNEIKVITNDCNYKKDKIDNIYKKYLKDNLSNIIKNKITIHNAIRGVV